MKISKSAILLVTAMSTAEKRKITMYQFKKFNQVNAKLSGGYTKLTPGLINYILEVRQTSTGKNRTDATALMIWFAHMTIAIEDIWRYSSFGFSRKTKIITIRYLLHSYSTESISNYLKSKGYQASIRSVWEELSGRSANQHWPFGRPGIYDYFVTVYYSLLGSSS